MKTQINKPVKSKINYTALVMAVVGLAVTFGWIPEEVEEAVVQITLAILPVAIMYFRTFKTEPEQ